MKGPPAKRVRSDLQSRIFTDEFQEKLRAEVQSSRPYPHGIIHGLLDDELLRQARTEMLENIQFTPKETDIYTLNQTGDLRNLDGLPSTELAQLESLAQVRKALYSPEFRALVTEVTQCGPLSGKKQDLSINVYDRGCHLLTHDDVIGSRKVSFILYLTPPDEEWDPKWGGALRLYPTLEPGVPATDWSASVPPAWNQLSFFKILPGRSFHDVEEVYVDKPRLSIQGWFHIPQEGEPGYNPEAQEEEDRANATLAQLERANEFSQPERTFTPISTENDDLSGKVSRHILDNADKLSAKFIEESMLILDDFLAPEFAKQVLAEIEAEELKNVPTVSSQVQKPWAVAQPPHIRRYLYLSPDAKEGALADLRQFLKSSGFTAFLQRLTTVELTSAYVEARRFRPGYDFTLASTSGVADLILEAVLTVTPARWSDNIGGYDLVMPGGDGTDDPAIYRSATEEDGPLLSELPARNRLVLILRDPDLLRFVKYVSRRAPGSRWDMLAQYEVKE